MKIISDEKELSTTETAEILEITPQRLIKLLESGELPIPYTQLGKHRRFRAKDVIKFKQKIDQQRLKT